jgi:hypothetical protein
MILAEIQAYLKSINYDKTEIYRVAKQAQEKGVRICPRNIFKDNIAREICVNHCRNKCVNCFNKYYIKLEV